MTDAPQHPDHTPGSPPPGPPPLYPPPSYPPPPYPPRRSRARLGIALGAAVVVVAAAIVVPVVLLSGEDQDSPGGGATGATEGTTAQVDLSEVQRYDDLPPSHVPPGEPVTYEQTPPAGGAHWSEWLECGVYDSPVRNENAVHDLEHGAVWITYDPALGAADVATLEDALPQNGIMSPYEGLAAPVVVTVWEAQLALTGADDPRLGLFIEQYDDGVTAPEPSASCAGGTASGRPA